MQISITRNKGIGTITFEAAVLGRALRQDLWRAFTELDADPETGVIVVTGRKNVFMAGADLKEVTGLGGDEAVADFLGLAHRLVERFCRSDKPVIAAINGYCLGGGLELALACDVRFAVSDFADAEGRPIPYLGFPEARLGLIPAVGGAHLAAELIGPGRAKELLFGAAPVTAQRACEIGLVNRLVPRAALMDEVEEAAREMLANSRTALAQIKRLLSRSPYTPGIRAALDDARHAFAACSHLQDTAARIAGAREEQRMKFRRMAGAA